MSRYVVLCLCLRHFTFSLIRILFFHHNKHELPQARSSDGSFLLHVRADGSIISSVGCLGSNLVEALETTFSIIHSDRHLMEKRKKVGRIVASIYLEEIPTHPPEYE